MYRKTTPNNATQGTHARPNAQKATDPHSTPIMEPWPLPFNTVRAMQPAKQTTKRPILSNGGAASPALQRSIGDSPEAAPTAFKAWQPASPCSVAIHFTLPLIKPSASSYPSVTGLPSTIATFASSADSFKNMPMPFCKVLTDNMLSTIASERVSTKSGKYFDAKEPMTAPAIVEGSIMTMMSQSINGRPTRTSDFCTLKAALAIDPPNMVKLDKAMACFGRKPKKHMYKGTRMPPPPMPPPAAITSAIAADPRVSQSTMHNGQRSLW
mmetsp:Transcript_61353/g.176574  ORF Transcript_61353/g.176574 Transcript_61353/m.176574 type:complete len:268 (+) Transcript_61353:722-1525(+)